MSRMKLLKGAILRDADTSASIVDLLLVAREE
jgi:hypothetical protein